MHQVTLNNNWHIFHSLTCSSCLWWKGFKHFTQESTNMNKEAQFLPKHFFLSSNIWAKCPPCIRPISCQVWCYSKKMQHFLFIFNETPCRPATTQQPCPATEIETGTTFWSPRSASCCSRQWSLSVMGHQCNTVSCILYCSVLCFLK